MKDRGTARCGFRLWPLHQLCILSKETIAGGEESGVVESDKGKFRPWAGKSLQLKIFLPTKQSAHLMRVIGRRVPASEHCLLTSSALSMAEANTSASSLLEKLSPYTCF